MAVIILMVFGIIAIFVPGKTIKLIYASLGALIFCIYLIYDTQMMMGKKILDRIFQAFSKFSLTVVTFRRKAQIFDQPGGIHLRSFEPVP